MRAPNAITKSTNATCPGCSESMRQLDLQGTPGVITGCERCGGLWLDPVGLTTVRAYALPSAAKLFLDAVTRSRKPARAGVYRASDARGICPVCRGALAAFPIEETTIRGERCEAHGTFFESAMAIRLLAVAADGVPVVLDQDSAGSKDVNATVIVRLSVLGIALLLVLLRFACK